MFWLLMNTRTTTETLVLALSEMSIVITMVITNGLKPVEVMGCHRRLIRLCDDVMSPPVC